ncbi:hypothetical protein EVC26_045 [Rhizobium phage RHph_I72]|nr:hypothetical protein EVC26_045 [Rhizobium phage RHph_I72]
MTEDQVHTALIDWLEPLLGITVIKADQSGTRPALPYGMTKLANSGPLYKNVDNIRYRDQGDAPLPMKVMPRVEYEYVYLFYIYGAAGADLMKRLQMAKELQQTQEPMYPAVTLVEMGRVNDVPELIGQRWEPRVQANLVVRTFSDEEFDAYVIEEQTVDYTPERV